ncbi:MAG: polymorphic toxin type 30 domain-containing protein, partial [Campylobacter hominis]
IGGSVNAIQGESFLDGAVISGINEMLSPLSKNLNKNEQILTSQLTGILTGALINSEAGAKQGYNLTTSAELNNRQLHKDEIEFINNKDNIENFKLKLKKSTNKSYSDDEAKAILTKAGVSLNDKSFDSAYKNNLSKEELNNINLAKEFIKQSSFYNANLGQLNAFNPTKEQYDDRYMYAPDIYNNNKEFYKDNLYINQNLNLFDYVKYYASSTGYAGMGLLKGAYDGTYDIGNMILHPIDFVNDIYTAISHPLQTKDAITSSINEFNSKNFIDSIISDQNSINYRTYKIPGEILVPIGAVAKTSKIGKLKNVNVTGKIAKCADNAIISTSNGVIVLPKTLSKQGTSKFTGDFTGLEGATVEEIFSRVPKEWKMLPQNLGQGIKFVDKAGIERIRIHAPDIKAPIGKNSNVGWVLRIQADDKGKKFYNNSGNIVNRNSNDGHIPIYGNPNLNK